MTYRKRGVICVRNPWDYLDSIRDYSIMIINPDSTPDRIRYLLDHADWSILIDEQGEHFRDGGIYSNERVYWYTSGTTGDSKFCSFDDQQVENLARRIVKSYDITSRDRYVSIMPLWHAHGQGFYWAAKKAGCEIHYSSIKNIRYLEKYQPTFVTAIPDVLRLIENFNLHDLRFIRSASAAMPADLCHRLEKKFHVPMIEAFGITEAMSHCFTNPLHGVRKVGTVGKPDGVDARIEDGRLLIKGPTVCVSEWYDTGDLAEVDSDGYYRIIGRSRDQINVRGIKVNPNSLESQLTKVLTDIDHCVIFGETRVKCVYVGDHSEQEVAKFLRSLGEHCSPDFVARVNAIPVAPSGKISRTWLLTHYSNA